MPDKITKFINSLDKVTRKRLKQRLLAVKNDPYLHRVLKNWLLLVNMFIEFE